MDVEKKATGGLEVLADEINAEHRAFIVSLKKTAEHGIRAGELLSEAKAKCPHGTWLDWLGKNFEGSARVAQEYMKFYNRREEIRANTHDGAHLGISSARELLSASREEADPFEEVFEFVETEARRLAALEVKSEPPQEPPENPTTLDEMALAANYHAHRGDVANKKAGEEILRLLERVREIYEIHDQGTGGGWLREALISVCRTPDGLGYYLSLAEAREKLLETVVDTSLRERIAWRIVESSGTIPVDLADEEAMLLRALAPETLEDVATAWEECKEYELALRKMETFTRPCDVPPSREHGVFADYLTDEQMQKTFAELRRSGKLFEDSHVAP